jgi:hybrid cluster-associated redox disulfide protein
MVKVTPEMIVSDVLKIDKGTVPIFFKNGLYCLGCPSAAGESLEDACAAHGIDVVKLIGELNEYFDKKQPDA